MALPFRDAATARRQIKTSNGHSSSLAKMANLDLRLLIAMLDGAVPNLLSGSLGSLLWHLK